MINVQSVSFEPVDSNLLPGKVMRVIIIGAGMEQRAQPILAEVGAQPVINLMPLIGEERGVRGFLASEPASGDELRIGFADEEMQDTGFKYEPNIS